MGSPATNVLVFSLPIALIAVIVIALTCAFCCHLLRARRQLLSQEQGNVGTQRRSFPKGLKKVNYKKKWLAKSKLKSDMCTICLEDFINKEEVNMCKCGHAYHNKCIMKWLEVRNSCPICQRGLQSRANNERTPLLNNYDVPIDV
ncbi:RING finger protein 24 [Nematostella vectensis]|nr:RING finger protein 24 [Nematostella vectensis]